MAPSTRSGGVPPPSRVYHSTPSLQQLQFPPRRQAVRTYGRSSRNSTPGTSRTRDPKQKTLTQIDWVSSSSLSDARTVVLSDSEEDEFAAHDTNKENDEPEEDDAEEQKSAVITGKRKRRSALNTLREKRQRRKTLGDEPDDTKRKEPGRTKNDESRRRTLGDTPLSSSSNYHTQTLTQFMGHRQRSLIKDSEDEDEDEDDGFDAWLGADPASPSPRAGKTQPSGDHGDMTGADGSTENLSRQSSVVPRTPAKRTIRFEIPSSSQQSTPISTRMLARYGPADKENPSPSSKGKQTVAEPLDELPGKPTSANRKMVIEDSFASEYLGSKNSTPVKGTPLKDITEEATEPEIMSSSMTDITNTPSRSRKRRPSAELGEKTPTQASLSKSKKGPSPKRGSIGSVLEIPDSDEEDGGFSEEDVTNYNDISDQENVDPNSTKQADVPIIGATSAVEEAAEPDRYPTGPETQNIFTELASSIDRLTRPPVRQTMGPPTSISRPQPPPATPSVYMTPRTNPPASPQLPVPQGIRSPGRDITPRPKRHKPLRKPLRHNPPSSQTQPMESQRVPLSTIQGFGHPTDRTDIFLPVSPVTVEGLASGHQVDFLLPSRIPVLVTRLWLYDGEFLRYAACAKAGEPDSTSSTSQWRYNITQMYELNNPLDYDDMNAEGWIEEADLQKPYAYLPPVGVSQLLANLRHALFGESTEEDIETEDEDENDPPSPPRLPVAPQPGSSFSVSQQVEAQLRSDIATHSHTHSGSAMDDEDAVLVPSTPLKSRYKSTSIVPGEIHPSQATTASQTSTYQDATQILSNSNQSGPTRNNPSSTRSRRRTSQRQNAPSSTPNRPLPHSCSSAFQDPEDQSPPISVGGAAVSIGSSQLLTKSQMLSDSLLQDDLRMPPDAWEFEGKDG